MPPPNNTRAWSAAPPPPPDRRNPIGPDDAQPPYPGSFWAKITDAVIDGGVTQYAFEQIDETDLVTPFDIGLSDGFAIVGDTATNGSPAYEANNNPSVPIGARVRVWPAGDLTYYMFAYDAGASAPSIWKTPYFRAATTAALPTNTYANGTAGVGATLTGTANGALASQDGVTLALNDDLLVKNEATSANNGAYTLTQVGTGSTPYILTRRTDADTGALLVGAVCEIGPEGSANANTVWVCAGVAPITVGTSSLPWVQIGAGGGGGGPYDRLSPYAITSVALTNPAGTTLATGKWYHITATAACSVTLPTVGTNGSWIGIRVVDGSTALLTLNAANPIGPVGGNPTTTSRIMWAGESAELVSSTYSGSPNWTKVAGVTIPMNAATAWQIISPDLNTSGAQVPGVVLAGGSSNNPFLTAVSGVVTLVRPGYYSIQSQCALIALPPGPGAITGTRHDIINSASTEVLGGFSSGMNSASANNTQQGAAFITVSGTYFASAADTLTPTGTMYGTGAMYAWGAAGGSYISVAELPQW